MAYSLSNSAPTSRQGTIMDTDKISCERVSGDASSMLQLLLPSNLKQTGRNWTPDIDQFHNTVAARIGKLKEVAGSSARIDSPNKIVFMPAKGVPENRAITAVKKLLEDY